MHELFLDTLEQRIEDLERQNAALARRVRRTKWEAMVLIGVACSLWVLMGQSSRPSASVADSVVAKRFILVDMNGAMRAELGTTEEGARLAMYWKHEPLWLGKNDEDLGAMQPIVELGLDRSKGSILRLEGPFNAPAMLKGRMELAVRPDGEPALDMTDSSVAHEYAPTAIQTIQSMATTRPGPSETEKSLAAARAAVRGLAPKCGLGVKNGVPSLFLANLDTLQTASVQLTKTGGIIGITDVRGMGQGIMMALDISGVRQTGAFSLTDGGRVRGMFALDGSGPMIALTNERGDPLWKAP